MKLILFAVDSSHAGTLKRSSLKCKNSSSCEVRHSTVPDSTVVGDMGVSPIATTAMTGFGQKLTAGMHATTSQVQGNAYGADGHAHPAVFHLSRHANCAPTHRCAQPPIPRESISAGGFIGGEILTPVSTPYHGDQHQLGHHHQRRV
jgi:hypothetical protein